LTPVSNDGGVDVIMTSKVNGKTETTFVEVKHFTHRTKVSRPIIQKLLGSSMMYKGDKCIVVTCGEYTKEALECVNYVNNLKLLGLTDIQQMILDLQPEQIAKVIMKTKNAS
jgi:HJR/Mrr/RecB family endonuclease